MPQWDIVTLCFSVLNHNYFHAQIIGLPGHICWPFTGCICSNHDVKSNYHYAALWMCEGKTVGATLFFVFFKKSHSRGAVERVKTDRSLEMSAVEYLMMPRYCGTERMCVFLNMCVCV